MEKAKKVASVLKVVLWYEVVALVAATVMAIRNCYWLVVAYAPYYTSWDWNNFSFREPSFEDGMAFLFDELAKCSYTFVVIAILALAAALIHALVIKRKK